MGVVSQVSPVQPGDTLAGRYRVERVIGVGGMGVVVAARHLDLDHLVAIKFLLSDVLENQDAVGRFTREARAAVKIQNEHVARVTDVGTLESGAPYMVMEYLEGADLEQFARTRGPLSVEDTVDFVLQACEAIAEAHGLGIVHRDLKPGNLFLVRRPDGSRIVKVLDFGISKFKGALAGHAVATTATMLGSPPYMSPEQLSTPRDIDSRTDIWSLGIIMYRLLTGRLPFEAETILELCVVIMHGELRPLREARPDVPRELEVVIRRSLEKNRMRRFASVAELARALIEFAPQRSHVSLDRILHLQSSQGATADTVPSQQAARSGGSEVPPGAPVIDTNASWGHTARSTKRSTRRGLLLIATAILVAGAGVMAGARLDRFRPKTQELAGPTSAGTPAAVTAAPAREIPIPEQNAAPNPAQPLVFKAEPQPSTSASNVPAPIRRPTRGAPRPPTPANAKAPAPSNGTWEEERK